MWCSFRFAHVLRHLNALSPVILSSPVQIFRILCWIRLKLTRSAALAFREWFFHAGWAIGMLWGGQSAHNPSPQLHAGRRWDSWGCVGQLASMMVSPICVLQMELLKGLPLHRTFLAVILNLLALTLSTTALLGSYWCTGTQKVPKPLCGKSKASQCVGVPMPSDADTSNVSSEDTVHYSWETGDDRFAFRYFHTGMWLSCEESMEGPGSVLLRQPQLVALYLLHRSLNLKGGRLRTCGRKVFFLFLDGISPVHWCS